MKPGTTQKYKPGFLFMAQNLKLPVIPVALNTGMFWPRSSTRHFPGKVIVEFMEPMMPGDDKNAFIEELQAKIEAKCAELNAETVKTILIRQSIWRRKREKCLKKHGRRKNTVCREGRRCFVADISGIRTSLTGKSSGSTQCFWPTAS